jgi:hypothetical protein
MAMSSSRFWIVAIASTALAGCNTMYTHYGDEDPGIGEAVKYDAAVQIINPRPVYAADSTQPGSNGEVGAEAVKRYRTDKVKPPANTGTTTGGGISGGSGGGAGMTGGPGL